MYKVYTITDIRNNKVVYVGSTKNFRQRKSQHLTLRSKNTSKWIAEIGRENLLIEPIAEFETEELALKYEDEMILKFNTIEDGYNQVRSGLIWASIGKAEYDRQWREEHPNAKKEWRANNLQKARDYDKWYHATHKEKEKEYYQRRKAEKAGLI